MRDGLVGRVGRGGAATLMLTSLTLLVPLSSRGEPAEGVSDGGRARLAYAVEYGEEHDRSVIDALLVGLALEPPESRGRLVAAIDAQICAPKALKALCRDEVLSARLDEWRVVPEKAPVRKSRKSRKRRGRGKRRPPTGKKKSSTPQKAKPAGERQQRARPSIHSVDSKVPLPVPKRPR